MSKSVGYVYRIVNKLNAKTYIGRHSPRPGEEWRTYLGSGVLVRKAIAKYGIENFDKELVSEHLTRDDLVKAEAEAIASEIARGKAEYNIFVDGVPPIDENVISKAVDLYLTDLLTVDDIAIELGISKPRTLSMLQSRGVVRERNNSKVLRNPRKRAFKVCVVCDKTFETSYKQGKGKTCSLSCRSKLGSKNAHERLGQ